MRGARNHWFDCVVGCAAAASMQGVERIGAAVQPQGDRKRLKLSELRARKSQGDGSAAGMLSRR